jgi:hypothetical protein
VLRPFLQTARPRAGDVAAMDAPILRFDLAHRRPPHHGLAADPVRVEITRGRVRQHLREVRGPVFLIGTSLDCDLVLGDPQFPESYAYLFVQAQRVSIRWLGSGPPLVVCGEAVETAELRNGDRVGFGPFELVVHIPGVPGGPLARFVRGPHRLRSHLPHDGADHLP